MLTAERGCIYRWYNPNTFRMNNEERYVLVVSSNKRSSDRLISIIFLSTDRSESVKDTIRFNFNNDTWILHTDLITYTSREYLLENVATLPQKLMKRLDNLIMHSLGIGDGVDWEKMYNNLLNEVVNRR